MPREVPVMVVTLPGLLTQIDALPTILSRLRDAERPMISLNYCIIADTISSEFTGKNETFREQRGRCSVGLEPYGTLIMPPDTASASQALSSHSSASLQ